MLNPINSLRLVFVKVLKRALHGMRFRGKGTLLCWLCPHDREIMIVVHGYHFRCNLTERIPRSIFLYDYDEEAVRFIRAHLRPGDAFVDVGANVGFYSLLASSIVGPNGRVVAVEPNPATFARLSRTAKENGITNITLCNLGLGDVPAKIDLYFGLQKGNEDNASMVAVPGARSVSVDVLPLDQLVAQLGLKRIDYLKVDVDGFEPKVFAGARCLLAAGAVRHLQCEFNDYWLRQVGSSPQALHDLITSHNLRDTDRPTKFISGCLVDRFFELNDDKKQADAAG